MYEVYERLAKERNLSNYAVAKATGVAQSVLSTWKSGKHAPSVETLRLLADFFNVSLDYLMTGEEHDRQKSPQPEAEGELQAYLDELKNRPEQRALFSLTRNATKEDVEAAVRIIDAFLNGNKD